MAFVASVPQIGRPTPLVSADLRPGFLRRLVRAAQARQHRRAEALVARYIADHGCRVTDSLEREIERRFLDR